MLCRRIDARVLFEIPASSESEKVRSLSRIDSVVNIRDPRLKDEKSPHNIRDGIEVFCLMSSGVQKCRQERRVIYY
jgi:hypothetical protein